jgi:EAP30/Vps36 family
LSDVLYALDLTITLNDFITVAAAIGVTATAAKLKVLGSGFGLVDVGRTTMVVSVPRELSGDAAAVLQVAITIPYNY